ncbi:hypothetical protein D3C76_1369890 [compost metagenome]
MAQVKRRQRRVDAQNVTILLLKPLAAAIHVHPVIKLFQRGITIFLNVLARVLAKTLIGQVNIRGEQIPKYIYPVNTSRAMITLDNSAHNVGDIEEAAAARTTGQACKQKYHQLFVRAYGQCLNFLVDRLYDLINLCEQKQPSSLPDTCRTVHTIGNAKLG